jgi:uncharacterized membrane protein YbhN (UPF0104 family)
LKTAWIFAEADARSAAAKKRVRFGIKVTLALALVGWLASRGGRQEVLRCLAGVSPLPFTLALAVYLAGQSLCAWKWGLLAGSLGFRRPLRFYWVHYLGAMFPSLFLPTGVGGDVFRTVVLARGGGDKVGATVSVLADRGTGVLGMAWIAALACVAGPAVRLPALAEEAIYALCASLTLGFLLPFFFRPAWARRGFLGRVTACWEHPRALLPAAGAATLFQGMLCLVYALLGKALQVPVDPLFYLLACPVVSVAGMSPITINGVGERVAALVVLFGLVGVGQDRAVAFGLAWTAMVTLASLAGGAVLFISDRQANWAAGENEEHGT